MELKEGEDNLPLFWTSGEDGTAESIGKIGETRN
jgi:hypothetical protein